jgi:hypothetical protein
MLVTSFKIFSCGQIEEDLKQASSIDELLAAFVVCKTLSKITAKTTIIPDN